MLEIKIKVFILELILTSKLLKEGVDFTNVFEEISYIFQTKSFGT